MKIVLFCSVIWIGMECFGYSGQNEMELTTLAVTVLISVIFMIWLLEHSTTEHNYIIHKTKRSGEITVSPHPNALWITTVIHSAFLSSFSFFFHVFFSFSFQFFILFSNFPFFFFFFIYFFFFFPKLSLLILLFKYWTG